MEIAWIVTGAVIAFFVAWNNGANNAADAIGTAVGSRALSLKKALIIAAIADFAGAMIFGSYVSETIMKGIVNVGVINEPSILMYGMLSSLIATGLWMFIASAFRIPMSISMAILGAILGFGLIAVGTEGIFWNTVILIFISWSILPGVSALVAALLYKLYNGMFLNYKLMPYVGSSSLFLIVFSASILLLYGRYPPHSPYPLIISLTLGVASFMAFMVLARFIVRKYSAKDSMDYMLKILIAISAAAIAFSHGSNDVAKSAAPLTAIILASTKGYIPPEVSVDINALTLCALGIAVGILSWGYRVVGTLGEEITTLTYSSAFTAQIAASIPLLIFTRLGMPVSTTMSVVGAIAGVGLAKGVKAVNMKTLAKIFGTWLVAVPAVMGLSAAIFAMIKSLLPT